MAIEWIKANLALKYAAFGDDEDSIRRKIIERASAGLIESKAETLVWGDTEHRSYRIPLAFWHSDEFSNDLVENWQQGDFKRRSRYETEDQAFGVSFDFVAISELVPAHRQAQAMREITVLSDQDWISARDLHQLMFANHSPSAAGSAIIEACQLGQIAARALRMTVEATDASGARHGSVGFGSMEWDVPLWLWREMIKSGSNQQWALNKVRADGYRNRQYLTYELQGVHFHRSGLVNLGLEIPKEQAAKGGRKPTYDWPTACLAIFGDIHRGDLKPDSQADIERALILHLNRGDKQPSESTVRPYAKKIWDESQKA